MGERIPTQTQALRHPPKSSRGLFGNPDGRGSSGGGYLRYGGGLRVSRGDSVVEFHCEDLTVENIKYHLRTPHSKSDRVAVFLPRWLDISDLFKG